MPPPHASRDLRTLLVTEHYFPPQVGGISRLLVGVLDALGAASQSCLTAAPAPSSPLALPEGLAVYRHPSAFQGNRIARHLHLAAIVRRIRRERSPELVQLGAADDGWLGLAIRRVTGLPYVVHAYGNDILDLALAPPDARLRALRGAARVLAISRYTAREVAALGVPPERIVIVPPGCDTDTFRPLPPDPELRRRLIGARRGPVLLTVGNIVPRKGHARVIRALPAILQRHPEATYVVAGGRDHAALLELARTLGVADAVAFPGSVADAALPALYAISDVFAMVSSESRPDADVEGFGIVFLEAAACGKPTVGGRSGGIPDAIEDGRTGLLVDPDDDAAVAGALLALLDDRDRAAAMGRAGRAMVEQRFARAPTAARIREAFDGVATELGLRA